MRGRGWGKVSQEDTVRDSEQGGYNGFHSPPSFPRYVGTAPTLPLPPYTSRSEDHSFHEFKGDGIKVTHFKSEKKVQSAGPKESVKKWGTQWRPWFLGQSPGFFSGLLVLQLAKSAASTASQSLLYPVLVWASVAFSSSSPRPPLAWWERGNSVDSVKVHLGSMGSPGNPRIAGWKSRTLPELMVRLPILPSRSSLSPSLWGDFTLLGNRMGLENHPEGGPFSDVPSPH